MDFQGDQWKKIENSRGVTVNFTGNPGGSTSKNSISSTGGLQFFLEKPIILLFNEFLLYVFAKNIFRYL